MKRINQFIAIFISAILLSCGGLDDASTKEPSNNTMPDQQHQTTVKMKSGYSMVNGLKMYYEIHGEGKPLVLIHGGGSTIETTFGRIIGPLAQHRKVIAVELQSHGHTPDMNRPYTFEQDADDVAMLLNNLEITKADIWGFSNGGNTAMQIAIRHPEKVNKIIIASSFYKREGMYDWFWKFMADASFDDMPAQLKEYYLKVAPDTTKLIAMHDKDLKRMQQFKDWDDEDIRSIKALAFVIIGDADVVKPEHAVEMYRKLPNAKLAILPGPHGGFMGEITTLKKNSQLPLLTTGMVEEFLDESQ